MGDHPPLDTPTDMGWAHLRLRRRRNVGKALRAGALTAVFAVCAAANHQVGLPCWESVFAGLQAFTLGLDTAPPAAAMARGGPWVDLVWLTRLIAPVLAAESVLFAALVSGIIGRPRFLLVDHVVVIGAGNLGRTFTEHLLDRDGSDGSILEVVVVDLDPQAPHLKELDEQGAWTVVGDGTLPAVLHEARVESARAVIIATDSDVANVAALWNARSRCLRGARVYAHLTDEHLRWTVGRALADDGNVEVFNLYDEAARLLVAREGLHRAGSVPVVIAGFGRLGRALHHHLAIDRCLVVDRDPAVVLPVRAPGDRQLCASVEGREAVERIVRFVQEGRGAPLASEDPEAADRSLDSEPGPSSPADPTGAHDAVVFVATDQDVRNLDLALTLSDRLSEAGVRIRLITRMLHFPGGDNDVLRQIGATSLARVVAASDRFRALSDHRATGLRGRLVHAFAVFSWWTGAV